MSRYLDTSLAVNGQPFGADANQWMQDAYNEQSAAAIVAWIGEQYNPAAFYLLYGGVLSSSAGTTTVTAGKCFFNYTFYDIPAASYPDPVGPDINIVTGQTTYGDGVGTTFEDSSVANVQILDRLICSAGAAGSGSLNYVDFVPCNPAWALFPAAGGWVIGGSLQGRYRLPNPFTKVVMAGTVVVGTTPAPLALGTLPSGYRPTELVFFSAVKYRVATTDYATIPIQIATTGVVSICNAADGPATVGDYVSLEGIEFYVV